MTRTAAPVLKRLHREFGDRIAFLTLYVREAHPGDRIRQAGTMEEKVALARRYAEADDVPWPVAVDGLDGSLHRALDAKPNAVYLADGDGTVVFRALWSNAEGPLRRAMGQVLVDRLPRREQTGNRPVPLLRGLGALRETLGAAGGDALGEFGRALPGAAALAGIASLVPSRSALVRGLVAAGAAVAVLAGAGWLLLRLFGSRPANARTSSA